MHTVWKTFTSLTHTRICEKNPNMIVLHRRLLIRAQVSGSLLQTAQTWSNAGVCIASCTHALGSMFVCLL